MAGLHIGATHLAALDDYIQAVEDAAFEAADIASSHIERSVRQRARASIHWSPLADHIQVASRDGYLVLGVAPDFVSEAMAAEYGTESTPPAPLLRTIGSAARGATLEAQQYLQAKFGQRF